MNEVREACLLLVERELRRMRELWCTYKEKYHPDCSYRPYLNDR